MSNNYTFVVSHPSGVNIPDGYIVITGPEGETGTVSINGGADIKESAFPITVGTLYGGFHTISLTLDNVANTPTMVVPAYLVNSHNHSALWSMVVFSILIVFLFCLYYYIYGME